MKHLLLIATAFTLMFPASAKDTGITTGPKVNAEQWLKDQPIQFLENKEQTLTPISWPDGYVNRYKISCVLALIQ